MSGGTGKPAAMGMAMPAPAPSPTEVETFPVAVAVAVGVPPSAPPPTPCGNNTAAGGAGRGFIPAAALPAIEKLQQGHGERWGGDEKDTAAVTRAGLERTKSTDIAAAIAAPAGCERHRESAVQTGSGDGAPGVVAASSSGGNGGGDGDGSPTEEARGAAAAVAAPAVEIGTIGEGGEVVMLVPEGEEEGAEEGDPELEWEMSKEWEDHLRKSPSVQRYRESKHVLRL